MNCFSGMNGNSYIWILILLLILGGGHDCQNGVLSGCTLPVLLALLYCLYKNGSLASLLNGTNGGCGCGCNG